MYSEVIRWHHQQVAYLLERMKSVREPDGRTLLDNATVLYGATLGDGNEHDPHDLPTLVAGRGGDTIRSGRVLEFSEPTDLSHRRLALLQSACVPIARFANSASPLEGIRT